RNVRLLRLISQATPFHAAPGRPRSSISARSSGALKSNVDLTGLAASGPPRPIDDGVRRAVASLLNGKPMSAPEGGGKGRGVKRVLRGESRAQSDRDWLHFLDGDSVAPGGMLAEAERVREGFDLLVGGRHLLTEEQTGAFDETALARRSPVGSFQRAAGRG